jgi:hypothetical protein
MFREEEYVMKQNQRISLAPLVTKHLSEVHERTMQHSIPVSVNSSTNLWKTRWWANYYIKMNFCIMYNAEDVSYVVCYKCNRPIHLRYIS